MHDSSDPAVVAYIGLGSNLDQPVQQLRLARQAIINLDRVKEEKFSSFYQSPPMGPTDQPDYVNAVMAIVTCLTAIELLGQLQRIEHAQGRVRNGQRWGARTLDLDLLIYGEQQIDLPDLVVPHIGISERAFVLSPLHEIAPLFVIPGLGPVHELNSHCPLGGLKKI